MFERREGEPLNLKQLWHAALGEPDHEVRAEHTVGGRRGDLLGEVAVLDHPGQLDRPAQMELTPPAAHLGGT